VLLEKENEITLGTAPELSKLIEDLQKEELNKDLSKASLETLSIVLYKNGVSRAEIDYIRGVNSSFTLRALSVRGLVEKTMDAKDNRRYIYKPSFELLSFMGVKSVEELPEYAEVKNGIEIAVKNLEEETKMEENN
jgi:segregation and condensation protein B